MSCSRSQRRSRRASRRGDRRRRVLRSAGQRLCRRRFQSGRPRRRRPASRVRAARSRRRGGLPRHDHYRRSRRDVPPAVDASRRFATRDPLATRLIAGIHIEGPFLNERRRVSRRASARRHSAGRCRIDDAAARRRGGPDADRDACARARPGIVPSPGYLASRGIVVSAGHTDATTRRASRRHRCRALDVHARRQRLSDADASPRQHRSARAQPGRSLVVVLHRRRRARAVCDAGNYLRLAREDRTVIVTDAIAPAGLGPGRYTLGRWDIVDRRRHGAARAGSVALRRVRDHDEAERGEPAAGARPSGSRRSQADVSTIRASRSACDATGDARLTLMYDVTENRGSDGPKSDKGFHAYPSSSS